MNLVSSWIPHLMYATTVIFGSLLAPYFKPYADIISSNLLEALINRIFVTEYGYIVFTIVYFTNVYFNGKNNNQTKRMRLLVYLLNTIIGIGIAVWFFGPLIFDRIDVVSGGHCDGAILPHPQCVDIYKWIVGFDCSGHTYILVSMSLLVWQVIQPIPKFTERRNDLENSLTSTTESKVATYLKCITTIILLIWYSMLVITCLFFHTYAEKVVGLLVGLALPASVIIFPRQ